MKTHAPANARRRNTTYLGATLMAAVAAASALAAVGVAAAAGDAVNPDERAIELYRDHGCGTCHAFAAAATTGQFAPTHDAMAPIAAARIQDPGYNGEATDAAGYVRESIVAPGAYLVDGYARTYHRMPAYSFLASEDVDALVNLLMGVPEEGEH